MPNFKINVDDKGNFFKKEVFKLVAPDLVGRGSSNTNVFLKLLSPKDAHIKVLTLTVNKTTHNVAVATGNRVTPGPYPMLVGENQISFEGHSDKPKSVHEFEVIPQLLK